MFQLRDFQQPVVDFPRAAKMDSMSEEAKRVKVICPSCQATLTIEPTTGLVIQTEAKQVDYSLKDAVQKEREKKSKADEMFAKAFQDEEDRHQSLEEKFKKAPEAKDELDDPTRPFDLD